MSTAEIAIQVPRPRPRGLGPLATLARRRFQLTARTPRELFVPLLTPIMFALVIAPALKTALHTDAAYESFVAIGTVGLLIPLNTMFAGIGVIVDREQGAQRELLAAPVPRPLLVLGNLSVALAVTALQVVTLIVVALARGIHFHASATGGLWFAAAATLFAIGMYGAAETLANRVPKQEEYIARVPAVGEPPLFLSRGPLPLRAPPAGPPAGAPRGLAGLRRDRRRAPERLRRLRPPRPPRRPGARAGDEGEAKPRRSARDRSARAES